MTAKHACPDPSCLRELLGDTLPENEQTKLIEHLDGCVDCQSRLEQAVDGSKLLVHTDYPLRHYTVRYFERRIRGAVRELRPCRIYFVRSRRKPFERPRRFTSVSGGAVAVTDLVAGAPTAGIRVRS